MLFRSESNPLAGSKQSAMPETETETETETEGGDKSPRPKAKRLDIFLGEQYNPDDIPTEWGNWAYDEMGLTAEEINFEWSKFCDYWSGCSGQKGVKLDWLATWRNWVRRVYESKKRKEELNGIYAR